MAMLNHQERLKACSGATPRCCNMCGIPMDPSPPATGTRPRFGLDGNVPLPRTPRHALSQKSRLLGE